MTPINLVTFLLSLALVDARLTAQRATMHSHPPYPTRLPSWLHRALFTTRPPSQPAPDARPHEGWYHSRQRQLMRLEADEAFRLRGAVLAALAARDGAVIYD